MPTIARIGPYRVFFYAGDGGEPIHVHVERDDRIAKIWLDPVRLARSGGFTRQELGRIMTMVQQHERQFIEAWNDYFGE